MAVVSHKYMPEHMPEDELKSTFAARQHTLDYLVKSLRDQTRAKTLTSYLLTGPRGAGKTTLILMLCSRISEEPALNAAWLPVRFPEELLTVASLRDLLATALDILADAGVAGAREWYERVEQATDEAASQDLAVAGLRRIAHSQKKRLILFVENLDFVFRRGLTDETKATLRRLLMTDPFMMIVGSAVHTFPELQSYDAAFFNYFCPIQLDRLSEEQSRELLARRAEWDRNAFFEERYRKHRAKIRAISLLTGGNPRLLLMLYEILTERELASVVVTLRALVDELTPVLKDILEHQLTEQQVKIVDALMQLDGKAKPSELAQKSRLSLNTVTTQVKRLEESHIVELHGGGKGRPAWYTIPDRLFYTWYQMRYLRPQRRRIEMFVEVLQFCFRAEERFAIMQQLATTTSTNQPNRARSLAVTIEYFAASLTKTKFRNPAREIAVNSWLKSGDIREAVGAYADFQGTRDGSENTATYMELGDRLLRDGDSRHAVQVLREGIERESDNVDLQLEYGFALGMSGDLSGACVCFDRVVKSRNTTVSQRALALFNRGAAKGLQGDTAGAMSDYTAVIEMKHASADQVASAFVARGEAKQQGDIARATEDYTRVIELKGAPVEEVATARVLRAMAKEYQYDTAGAIADYNAVISLKGAPLEIRVDAGTMVLHHAWPEGRHRIDHCHAVVAQALEGMSNDDRARYLSAYLASVTGFGERDAWLHAFRVLTKDQPEEVTRQLEPLPIVADVLESGDRSKLDPLPPEQRDFALEVLRKFEPGHSAWIRS